MLQKFHGSQNWSSGRRVTDFHHRQACRTLGPCFCRDKRFEKRREYLRLQSKGVVSDGCEAIERRYLITNSCRPLCARVAVFKALMLPGLQQKVSTIRRGSDARKVPWHRPATDLGA
jgi:hypothetical protein